MGKMFSFCSMISVFVLAGCMLKDKIEVQPPLSSTEKFVIEQLMTENGLLKTDLKEQKDVYLSESVGLWLVYLYEKGDKGRFAEQVEVLENYFMQDGLITWRIDKNKASSVNALIDDYRIMYALLAAGDAWSMPTYRTLAKKIGAELVEHSMVQGILVDYMDGHTKETSSVITLSYIMPEALNLMEVHGIVTKEQKEAQFTILRHAQQAQEGYMPKTFDIAASQYLYESELHMIDQLYTALHKAQLGENTEAFTKWLLKIYKRDKKIYGRYDAASSVATVNYESPAVYALAVRYMLEIDNKKMARKLFKQMEKLQNEELEGYGNGGTLDTHIFDNLLPLTVEREMAHAFGNK